MPQANPPRAQQAGAWSWWRRGKWLGPWRCCRCGMVARVRGRPAGAHAGVGCGSGRHEGHLWQCCSCGMHSGGTRLRRLAGAHGRVVRGSGMHKGHAWRRCRGKTKGGGTGAWRAPGRTHVARMCGAWQWRRRVGCSGATVSWRAVGLLFYAMKLCSVLVCQEWLPCPISIMPPPLDACCNQPRSYLLRMVRQATTQLSATRGAPLRMVRQATQGTFRTQALLSHAHAASLPVPWCYLPCLAPAASLPGPCCQPCLGPGAAPVPAASVSGPCCQHASALLPTCLGSDASPAWALMPACLGPTVSLPELCCQPAWALMPALLGPWCCQACLGFDASVSGPCCQSTWALMPALPGPWCCPRPCRTSRACCWLQWGRLWRCTRCARPSSHKPTPLHPPWHANPASAWGLQRPWQVRGADLQIAMSGVMACFAPHAGAPSVGLRVLQGGCIAARGLRCCKGAALLQGGCIAGGCGFVQALLYRLQGGLSCKSCQELS